MLSHQMRECARKVSGKSRLVAWQPFDIKREFWHRTPDPTFLCKFNQTHQGSSRNARR